MSKCIWMRVSGHRKQILRRTAAHGRKQIYISVTICFGDLPHEIVNIAESIINEVVNVGRHGEIEADMTSFRVVGQFLKLLSHYDEPGLMGFVDLPIMILQDVLAGLVEQAMVGDPERDSELAMTQENVATAGLKI